MISCLFRYRQVCDKGYKFDGEEPGKDTAKFSQLVWKATSNFGIAYATKKTKDNLYCTYIVAKYSPAGNKVGSYKENVQQGSFTASICDSLNTIAFNAAMEDAPKTYSQWSLGPEVANQVLTAVRPEAGTVKPLAMPIYHKNFPSPVIWHSKRCKHYKTDNAVCRGNFFNPVFMQYILFIL